jgi:AmiR/NasT family two-component response regulator
MNTVHPADPVRLRVLVADGHRDRLEEVARAVASLGHEVISRETDLSDIGPVTAAEDPDVALVIVGEDSQRALATIGDIVQTATCPVIAILDIQDRRFVNEAAKRGLFAHITEAQDPEELQSSIDIVLRRFAEYHALEGAFARRAVTERAKGILMERHGIDEQAAFELLRTHARRTNRKIVDVAQAVIGSRQLLPRSPGGGRQEAVPDDPTDASSE